MKSITITISKTGEVTLATAGYPGDACRQASAPYERALGLTTRDEPTAELFLTQPDTATEGQG